MNDPKNIKLLRKRAEAGDREAARFLIEEFVNHADAFERGEQSEADREVIPFIARGLREILKGKPPLLALCIDKPEGRPKIDIVRDLNLAFAVRANQRKHKSTVVYAIKGTARASGIGEPTVRKAWKRFRKVVLSVPEPKIDPYLIYSMPKG